MISLQKLFILVDSRAKVIRLAFWTFLMCSSVRKKIVSHDAAIIACYNLTTSKPSEGLMIPEPVTNPNNSGGVSDNSDGSDMVVPTVGRTDG